MYFNCVYVLQKKLMYVYENLLKILKFKHPLTYAVLHSLSACLLSTVYLLPAHLYTILYAILLSTQEC